MQDTNTCPYCKDKLKNKNYPSNSTVYIERTCAKFTHLFSIRILKENKEVQYLKMSLNHKYKNEKRNSTFLEVYYHENKSRFSYMIAGDIKYIEVPRILDVDLNNLSPLLEKANNYITLS